VKDLEFTLEREDILRALREEYEPLGLSVTDLTEVDDTMVGVLTPTAAPGRHLEARLDDASLMTSVARHVLRVIGLVVVRSERVAEGEMRIWAQLSDGRCPTCGSPVGGGMSRSEAPTPAPRRTEMPPPEEPDVAPPAQVPTSRPSRRRAPAARPVPAEPITSAEHATAPTPRPSRRRARHAEPAASPSLNTIMTSVLTDKPGTAGRTLPVPNRTLLVSDHEVVTVPSLTPQVVSRTMTTAGEVERLEVDIPPHMEPPKDA
jgi:hypothetical protein